MMMIDEATAREHARQLRDLANAQRQYSAGAVGAVLSDAIDLLAARFERSLKEADILQTLELWERAYSRLTGDEARAARIEASKKTELLLAKVRGSHDFS